MSMNRRQVIVRGIAAAIVAGHQPLAAWAASGQKIVVHKSESCGCCNLWIKHLEQAGFEVEAINQDNLGPVKERVGVPYGKGSCHTAEVNGYFVEGHVPAADIKRLLQERLTAKGLTVPGMPAGSPGMEMANGRVDAYDVLLVAKDGSTSVFAHHGPRNP